MNFTAAQLEEFRNEVLDGKQPLDGYKVNVMPHFYYLCPEISGISWISNDYKDKGYKCRVEYTIPKAIGPTIADPLGQLKEGDKIITYFDMANTEHYVLQS